MDYVYNFISDGEIEEPSLIKICDEALKRARLKAPIKTGNLRKSIKYRIENIDVVLYVDTAMYKSGQPYYDYVNTAPKKSGAPRSGNGYWVDVIKEFGSVFYANLDSQFQKRLKAEKDEEKKQEELKQRNIEKKKREEENKRKTQLILEFMLAAALIQTGVQNERKKQ